MDDTIVTIYCLCDDFLKATHYRDDPQVRLSSAEVMTVSLVGAALFGGNLSGIAKPQKSPYLSESTTRV